MVHGGGNYRLDWEGDHVRAFGGDEGGARWSFRRQKVGYDDG